MIMSALNYKVIYRNGDRIPFHIANFSRTAEGSFVFEYVDNPKYSFPGFDPSKRKYENDTLWDQIAFRIPNNIRNQFPSTPSEDLIEKTEGKLVTDHFEFQLA